MSSSADPASGGGTLMGGQHFEDLLKDWQIHVQFDDDQRPKNYIGA